MSRLQLRDVHDALLSGLTHEFSAGSHWIVCADASAATHLVNLCGGLARPKRGQLDLDGTRVSALPYRELGVLPTIVTFPRARVERLLDMALQLKGVNRSAQQLLGDWDLTDLGRQFASDLDATSARRVALILALATPSPKLLALHDAFNLGLSRERILAALVASAERGAVVLMTTDRSELQGVEVPSAALTGASIWVLQPSRLVQPDQLPRPRHAAPIHTLFVVCSDARSLSELLSRDSRVTSLRLDERCAPHLVEIAGTTLEDVASAVADAALHRNIDVRQMTSTLSPLFGLPASIAPAPEPALPAAHAIPSPNAKGQLE